MLNRASCLWILSSVFIILLFDCVDPMLPRHILILDGPAMYATALMWVGHFS